MEDEQTLCWRCANFTKCSWSLGVPVEGWTAEPTEIRDRIGTTYERVIKSYLVRDCPRFEADKELQCTAKMVGAIIGYEPAKVATLARRKGGLKEIEAELLKRGYSLRVLDSATYYRYILKKL